MLIDINSHQPNKDWINDFLPGHVAVSSSPIRLKVGASELVNRSKLMVINDATCVLQISKTNVFNPGEFIVLLPGERITFHINPEKNIVFYGKTDEISTTIRVIEVI